MQVTGNKEIGWTLPQQTEVMLKPLVLFFSPPLNLVENIQPPIVCNPNQSHGHEQHTSYEEKRQRRK